MMSLPFVPSVVRGGALVAVLAGATACAPASPMSPQAQLSTSQSSPVLLSCPAGQQALLRQTVINGAAVPQVECVTAPAAATLQAQATAPQAAVQAYAPAPAPVYAAAPAYAPAPVYASAPQATPVAYRPAARTSARRAVYGDDEVIEYKKPRSWKKSAVIIGSAAGVGAGVGGATKGKKGALIGAAIGGGAAAIWDQVTRR